MRRLTAIFLVFIMLFGMSACTSEFPGSGDDTTLGGTTAGGTTETTDDGTGDVIPEVTVIYKSDPPYSHGGDENYEGEVKMTCYSSNFWGMDYKTLTHSCADAIVSELQKQTFTGESVEKISDTPFEEFFEYDLPVEVGTFWLEVDDKIYRINSQFDQISRVETYLGEGEVLTFSDELKSIISNAWSYCHRNTYWGTYKDGVLTLSHMFLAEATAEIKVKDMHINTAEGVNNTVTVEVLSKTDREGYVQLECYSGGCIVGDGDSEALQLQANAPKTVTLSFDASFLDDAYYISIDAGNTRVEIFIDLRQD